MLTICENDIGGQVYVGFEPRVSVMVKYRVHP